VLDVVHVVVGHLSNSASVVAESPYRVECAVAMVEPNFELDGVVVEHKVAVELNFREVVDD